MNDLIIFWVLFILTFLLGLYIGAFYRGKIIADEIKEEIKEKLRDKPKPGVVRQLTEAEKEEKHDPKKQGNLEAFNKLMTDLGVKKPA